MLRSFLLITRFWNLLIIGVAQYFTAIFLIDQEKIDILTKTMVKEVRDRTVVVQRPDGTRDEIAYGTLVWAVSALCGAVCGAVVRGADALL